MTAVLDVVLIVAWISVVVFIGWQVTRKPASVARTGARGPRQRARSGNGGMSVRFTPPPRYVPDPDAPPEPSQDRLAAALAGLTPALLCTLCVIELKQARAGGEPDPEVHPGVVMGDVVINGRPSTAVVCEVRHPLGLGAFAGRPLLAAPADA
jgi:hypothetical protein